MTENAKTKDDTKLLDEIGNYKYGFHDRDDNYVFKSERGLNRQVVENISRMKGEPQWMLEFRLKALEHYLSRPMPTWGPDLSGLELENIFYYVKPTEKSEKSGTTFRTTSRTRSTNLGFQKPSRNSFRVWVRSMSPRWCITPSLSILKSKA